ncbi:hypothetical protein [Streptomyces sp. NPDC056549]|uniref:hypothetical protein n=1 Tax=Streptomyces sp. NPDC056549 TaxID=3345864 RepID=UPI0036B15CC2
MMKKGLTQMSHSKSETVAAFIDHLRRDPGLQDAIQSRPQDRFATLDDAVDYAVRVAGENGHSVSREEIFEAMKESVPTGEGSRSMDGFKLSAGALGFKNVVVGVSNPSEVMCQYHAPLAFLGTGADDVR